MTTTIPKPPLPSGSRLMRLAEAMATPHSLDRYLELVNPMMSARELRAEVTEVWRQTDDTVTLTLRPTRQWRGFTAGQFVNVGVVVDGIRHTRCYSPACSQYRRDGRFELTVKAQEGGVVSPYLFGAAEPGLVVHLSQAAGEFVLPQTRPDRILLISGGSGITPVLSMLRTLCDENYDGTVTFLHYAYTDRDVAYAAELRQLAAAHANVDVVLAYTDQDNGGDLHGFFGTEHLDTVAPWFRDAQTYLCGPPGLMRAVRTEFREHDIESRLHTEEFAPVVAIADDDATGTVRFVSSGVQAENSGASLLEQAEEAGLSPTYGCRMGICFSCTAVKTSGCTRNLRTGETDSDPDQPIQLCISAPVGDVEIQV
ncbi:ferredoxin reductase [Aldersonia sp. NBC_00410]|uniref:ferredoxin reductase n=1 Tax=Aldersonia sp. NBC_00410 TaxID=2975954 RepID=UPI0022520FDD|nr:ferredoxin reductase [Aldersonia sp. NBC_00410]MCX5042840.1 ferredoxin reductase [Aldersonia sp. NBC_00410]